MSIVEKTVALLTAMNPADVQALSPFERRRLAETCRYWAKIAERPAARPAKSGVLLHLETGSPRHE
jgi:hypothetical protein